MRVDEHRWYPRCRGGTRGTPCTAESTCSRGAPSPPASSRSPDSTIFDIKFRHTCLVTSGNLSIDLIARLCFTKHAKSHCCSQEASCPLASSRSPRFGFRGRTFDVGVWSFGVKVWGAGRGRGSGMARGGGFVSRVSTFWFWKGDLGARHLIKEFVHGWDTDRSALSNVW